MVIFDDVIYLDVYKIISYQYFPETDDDFVYKDDINIRFFSKGKKQDIYNDISAQLNDMHSLGIVHGDISIWNIIHRHDRYILIDYGRSVSTDNIMFPKHDYLESENLSVDMDFEYLKFVLDRFIF